MTVIYSKPVTLPPAVAEQYELLRAAMLGAALPPDTRAGLFVFLHRGMLAWARTILLDTARQAAIAAATLRPSNLDRLYERRAVVQLLAAMAMTITDRSPA